MATAFRFTSADLDELPRWEGVRWEIIKGELYVATVPHWNHQCVVGSIGNALRSWDHSHARGCSVSAPGLIFSPEDDVVPDVVWISQERFQGALNDDGHLIVAPELIAEVLMPGPMHQCRDRVVKLDLYSRHDVEEYWIVDWQVRLVETYRRIAGQLQRVETLTGDATLTSPLLPGFSCPISSFWVPAPPDS